MRIGRKVAWLGALGVLGSAAACGGAPFMADVDAGDPMPGVDAAPSQGDASQVEGRDAGTMNDAQADRHAMPDAASDAASDAGDAAEAHDDATAEDASVDAGHDATNDAGPPCATKKTSDEDGVFLVPSGGTAVDGCMNRVEPCGDLASAIAKATAGSFNHIYVAAGTYVASGTVAIKDGITIEGGWTVANGIWKGSCDPADTPTFKAAVSSVLTVGSAAAPSAATVTLDTVNVVNTSVASTAESLYGIFAVGTSASSLVLNDVGITVPAGGTGATGTNGMNGGAGISGGCIQSVGADPSNAGTGSVGVPAGGSYGVAGFMPGAPDTTEGGDGLKGATLAPVTACLTDVPVKCSEQSCEGQPNTCRPSPCEAVLFATVCTGETMSGCGGYGGSGGLNGGGGGSSIALYLWGENATLEEGAFTAAAGGVGGAGGAGGSGGAGGPGGSLGTSATYGTGCLALTPFGGQTTCTLATASKTASSGAGGNNGGTGGEGGGGVGGDSYAYYAGGGAVVTLMGAPTFTWASPAAGGAPNGPLGFSGRTNTSD